MYFYHSFAKIMLGLMVQNAPNSQGGLEMEISRNVSAQGLFGTVWCKILSFFLIWEFWELKIMEFALSSKDGKREQIFFFLHSIQQLLHILFPILKLMIHFFS